jgi:hypothetical protein
MGTPLSGKLGDRIADHLDANGGCGRFIHVPIRAALKGGTLVRARSSKHAGKPARQARAAR